MCVDSLSMTVVLSYTHCACAAIFVVVTSTSAFLASGVALLKNRINSYNRVNIVNVFLMRNALIKKKSIRISECELGFRNDEMMRVFDLVCCSRHL